MPRCDGCGQRCGCVLVDGDNTQVLGSGSRDDPFRVNVDVDGAGGTRLVGEIIMHGAGVAPTGWLICDGAAVSRTTYAALFTALGTAYGAGDGSTTFNLPDLAGRAPFGVDGSHARGSTGGVETITLTTGNLPGHTHTMAHTHAVAHTHAISHSHVMNHGHGSTSSNGDHHHTVGQSNDDGSNNNTFRRGAQKDRDVNTGNDGVHAHTVADFAGSTGADTTGGTSGADSTGGTSGASSAANTGSTGSATPYTNMPPYTAVSFIIKT